MIGRDGNVLQVDFYRGDDPMTPTFPGAGAMRMVVLPAGEEVYEAKTLRAA